MLQNSPKHIKYSIIYSGLAIILLTALQLGSQTPVSQAAPLALPPCGDNTVSGSANSGTPDIGQSANGQYTAVVWAEGTSGVGAIKLAYSEALTQTYTWSFPPGTASGVVASGGYGSPRLDFNPTVNNRVHMVYRNINGLGYARCPLTAGICDVTSIAGTSGATNPQIVATPKGIVIVYVQNGSIRLIHFADSATPNVLSHGLLSNGEQPALAYSNGYLHIVYKTSGGLVYQRFSDANVGTSATLAPVKFANIGAETDMDAQQPAIAALGNTVMVVWSRLKVVNPVNDANLSAYRVFQNFSRDNGDTWNGIPTVGAARSIPAHKTVAAPEDLAINDDLWVSYNDVSSRFYGLQPDVFLSENSGQIYAHVVWHAQMYENYQEIILPGQDGPDRGAIPDNASDAGHDILYAFAPLGATAPSPPDPGWTGIPVGNDGVMELASIDPNGRTGSLYSSTHHLTDLTAWYFFDSYVKADDANGAPSGNGSGRDTIRPRIFFQGNSYTGYAGEHFNRLQLVYLSQSNVNNQIYDVRYNGFELGLNNFSASPDPAIQDSDCDSISDQVEIQRPPDNDTNPDLFCNASTSNTYGEMNCDIPSNIKLKNADLGDYVPDFMDTDADGDGIPDVADAEWRVSFLGCNGPGSNCVFLPLVLKQ